MRKNPMQQADFQRLMQDATRLTSQGDLDAALAAIQAALGGGPGATPSGGKAGLVIDVEARIVPDDPVAGELDGPAAVAPNEAPTSRSARPASTPAGAGAFIAGRFGGAGLAGRDYKLYVPPQAGDQPLPLVVMLHGCTQDPDDFAAGTAMNEAAREYGFHVLYPAQSEQANPQRCWNWFKHTHQQRGRGEPALLAGMVRELMTQRRVDKARVYVAGLSAGGAMAAILGDTYPDVFAAIGVHSGLATGTARDLPSALEAMKHGPTRPAASTSVRPVPAIVIHGDADKTVHPANGEQLARAGARTGMEAETESLGSPRGRQATRRVHRDAAGRVVVEHWVIHGAPHAWSGGTRKGSYTDPGGPDATAAMVRFFMDHPRA
jgi:poly(hydroxyalkanoate) depolymerase family esterase